MVKKFRIGLAPDVPSGPRIFPQFGRSGFSDMCAQGARIYCLWTIRPRTRLALTTPVTSIDVVSLGERDGFTDQAVAVVTMITQQQRLLSALRVGVEPKNDGGPALSGAGTRHGVPRDRTVIDSPGW